MAGWMGFLPGDPEAFRNVIANNVPTNSGKLANLPLHALYCVVERQRVPRFAHFLRCSGRRVALPLLACNVVFVCRRIAFGCTVERFYRALFHRASLWALYHSKNDLCARLVGRPLWCITHITRRGSSSSNV